MAGKNWMEKLQKMDGAVTDTAFNPLANVIRTPSPSVNFAFGKFNGLPRGYSAAFYGPPGGGKSLLANATIGQMHRDDPEGWAMKFDTEFRETAQLPPSEYPKFGIDGQRYTCFSVNNPDLIFNRTAKEVATMCQDGMPLRLVVIDSANQIVGRRSLDQQDMMVQNIGDVALTLKEGLKHILPVQRKYNFALIMTVHVGAEMDRNEQMRGNKVRMAAGFGLQHHTEFFMLVEQNKNKDARQSLLEEKFENADVKDLAGNEDRTGHKIRVVCKKNSLAPAGRVGEFTLDYNKGIVNTYEEVFLLGINRGIIQKPTQQSYEFAGKKWVGKAQMIAALRDYPELAADVIKQLQLADIEGRFIQTAEEKAQEIEH